MSNYIKKREERYKKMLEESLKRHPKVEKKQPQPIPQKNIDWDKLNNHLNQKQ